MTSLARRSRVQLRRFLRRVRARFGDTSPVLIIGVLVFLSGFGLTLLRSPAGDGEGGRVSLVRTVNRVLGAASTYLPGELTDPETRERVNILVVAMLSEALPPRARERLEGSLTATRRWFRRIFTLSSLVTLIPLAAGYVLLAGWLDRRSARRTGPDPPGLPTPPGAAGDTPRTDTAQAGGGRRPG